MFHSNHNVLSIYSRSPVWLQNIFFTIHGMIKSIQYKKVNELIKQKNFKNFKNNKDYNKEQFKNIKKILVHAYNNVPYYKEIFEKNNIDLKSFKTLEDFKNIPIIFKGDIVSNQSKFLSRNRSEKWRNNPRQGHINWENALSKDLPSHTFSKY